MTVSQIVTTVAIMRENEIFFLKNESWGLKCMSCMIVSQIINSVAIKEKDIYSLLLYTCPGGGQPSGKTNRKVLNIRGSKFTERIGIFEIT